MGKGDQKWNDNHGDIELLDEEDIELDPVLEQQKQLFEKPLTDDDNID